MEIVLWLAWEVAVFALFAYWATKKARNPVGWGLFAAGTQIPLMPAIILGLLPRLCPSCQGPLRSQETKCPHCGKSVVAPQLTKGIEAGSGPIAAVSGETGLSNHGARLHIEQGPVIDTTRTLDMDRVYTLRPEFEKKSTEKLLKIYEKRSGWWADEAYEAIRLILLERGQQVPKVDENDKSG
jgi:hypothetical protein